jgi:excisionase family DNA binding protein
MQYSTNPTKNISNGLGDVDQLFGLDRTAQILSVSIWTIRKWVSNKRIKSIKLGGRRMIPKSEIQRITSEGLTE